MDIDSSENYLNVICTNRSLRNRNSSLHLTGKNARKPVRQTVISVYGFVTRVLTLAWKISWFYMKIHDCSKAQVPYNCDLCR